MPLKISKKPAASTPKATVTKEQKASGEVVAETQDEETPDIKTPQNLAGDQWCNVGFEASYTHNLGNYQSTRVAVHLSVPCPHGEIDEVFETAQTWVNERMEQLVEDLNSDE